jgi:hypothetical protein
MLSNMCAVAMASSPFGNFHNHHRATGPLVATLPSKKLGVGGSQAFPFVQKTFWGYCKNKNGHSTIECNSSKERLLAFTTKDCCVFKQYVTGVTCHFLRD